MVLGDNMKKKILVLLVCSLLLVTGCGKDKINTTGKAYLAKENMLKLDNLAYDVKLTTKVMDQDVTINMDCKQDIKNKRDYCKLDAIGIKNEMYTDYANKYSYTRVDTSSVIGSTTEDNKWVKSKITTVGNSWLNIANYIFNETKEEKDGNTIYRGTINTKKLTKALTQMNTKSINFGGLMSKDIPIEVVIDSNNYIKKINFELEIIGVKEVVNVTYKDYNSAGDVTLPNVE